MTTQAPPRPCLRCGNPAAPEDSLELTTQPMIAASGPEAQAEITARWQQQPTAGPVPVHLDCLDHPETLSKFYMSDHFARWAVASIRRLEAEAARLRAPQPAPEQP